MPKQLKPMKYKKAKLHLVLATLGCFSLSLAFPWAGQAALRLKTGEPPVKLAPGSPALGLQNAFVEVAAAVSPAVVNISAEWTVNLRGFGDFGDPDEFFNFFFFGPRGRPQGAPPAKQKQHSLGTGFLVSSDGYILTNAHVIEKAEKVTVIFEDGSHYPAKIIGKDEANDVGVIKITDGKNTFPVASLGDSSNVKVGQWAIAIGNPFGFHHTVTAGVISAKGRNIPISNEEEGGETRKFQNYIQTDASINPGNSGGPLCNIQGEVIGINAAIFSQTGGSVGIGFAIPINLARKVAEGLITPGKVARAGLGAVVGNLDAKLARSFGLSGTEGALINSVSAGSAAEKAGLKPGDVILKLNGEKILDFPELVDKLYNFQPGETVQVTFFRNGQESQVPVTLQSLSEKELKVVEKSPEKKGEPRLNSDLGMAYQDQTADIQRELPEGAPRGPVITQVDPQGPAAMAGFQAGDVVLKVGNADIYSANQLTTVLRKSDLKEGVRLFIWRNGVTLFGLLQTGD